MSVCLSISEQHFVMFVWPSDIRGCDMDYTLNAESVTQFFFPPFMVIVFLRLPAPSCVSLMIVSC